MTRSTCSTMTTTDFEVKHSDYFIDINYETLFYRFCFKYI